MSKNIFAIGCNSVPKNVSKSEFEQNGFKRLIHLECDLAKVIAETMHVEHYFADRWTKEESDVANNYLGQLAKSNKVKLLLRDKPESLDAIISGYYQNADFRRYSTFLALKNLSEVRKAGVPIRVVPAAEDNQAHIDYLVNNGKLDFDIATEYMRDFPDEARVVASMFEFSHIDPEIRKAAEDNYRRNNGKGMFDNLPTDILTHHLDRYIYKNICELGGKNNLLEVPLNRKLWGFNTKETKLYKIEILNKNGTPHVMGDTTKRLYGPINKLINSLGYMVKVNIKT